MPDPMQEARIWWRRNWTWIVPVAALGVLAAFAACVGTIVLAVFALFKSSDVYVEAVRRAESSAAVVRELAEPVRAGWWVTGRFEVTPSAGSAAFATPVYGPRSRAVLHAVAWKRDGRWRFDTLEIAFEDRPEHVDLLERER
jgi:hypothetical protein